MNNRKIPRFLKNWNKLSKFRLSVMNACMPLVGLYGTTGHLDPKLSAALFTGNLFLAMSSQINGQIYEKEFDRVMSRTCNRPLVTDKVTEAEARKIGVATYVLGNLVLAPTVSWESTLVSNVTFWSYFGYMWLKRRSKWNLPFGGIVGCLPILSGAVAIAGFGAVNQKILFDMAFLYIWQMTHFLQILTMNKDDYTKAKFVMLEKRDNILLFQILFLLAHILLVIYLPEYTAKETVLKWLLAGTLAYQMYLLPNFRSGIAPYALVRKEKKAAYLVAFIYFALYHSKQSSQPQGFWAQLKNRLGV